MEEVIVLFLDLFDLKLKLLLLGFCLRYIVLDRSYLTLFLIILFLDLFSCILSHSDVLLIVLVFFFGNAELFPLVLLLVLHIIDLLVLVLFVELMLLLSF